MRLLLLLVLGFVICRASVQPASAQTIGDEEPVTCPGDAPGTLSSLDCRYRMRFEGFVTSSVTDQAALGAVFFGSIAQWQNNPREWNRGVTGFADRVGSRYGQNFAKGLTELSLGFVLHTDPRHISYAADVKNPKTGVRPRIGHALMDFLTVRRSTSDGKGHRCLNVPLLAGAAASGFVGNAWYPPVQATPQQAGIRASYSLGTALFSSFYTEFKPEVGQLLATIFKRKG